MPRNFVPAEDRVFDKASLLAFYDKAGDCSERRKKMLSILKKAMVEELTEPQRFCLTEYYIHDKKMKDIARSLSVHPSTVTRHISRAKKKLRHIASYY